VSCHVLQSDDVAGALLAYAESNHVSLIVLGAATHGLALRRWIPTVPARVAAEAPCSVLLVKDAPPFDLLRRAAEHREAAEAVSSPRGGSGKTPWGPRARPWDTARSIPEHA
jgi:K+-sensing histidine kinase KdpD